VDAKALFDLSEKVAIVAGGSRGIGFAIAEGLASAGATVVVANSTPEQGERAAAAIRAQGRQARALFLDLRRPESIAQMISATRQAFGRIDILVNSVGIIRRGPIEEVSTEDWDAI